MLITPSDAAHDAICGGCGGVAYLDVFTTVNGNGGGAAGDGYGYMQPAWVFPQKLGNSAKNIAEAVSHEVGHNLGLDHDGNASGQGYDRGHGAWAPIMGVGYDRPIAQWSKGDYAGANNQQDDVAIIRAATGSRTDEARPASSARRRCRPVRRTSRVAPTSTPSCSAPAPARRAINARAAGRHADLDIKLTLLDATGQVVATRRPGRRRRPPASRPT